MKKKILAVLLFLFVIELLFGTFGGIRTIYFQENLSASDSIRTTWFTALGKNTTEVVFQLKTEDRVWSIGLRGGFQGEYGAKRLEEQIIYELNGIADTESAYDGEKVMFEQTVLHRMEILLPYVGSWNCKRVIRKLKKEGIIVKCKWRPFLLAFIPPA